MYTMSQITQLVAEFGLELQKSIKQGKYDVAMADRIGNAACEIIEPTLYLTSPLRKSNQELGGPQTHNLVLHSQAKLSVDMQDPHDPELFERPLRVALESIHIDEFHQFCRAMITYHPNAPIKAQGRNGFDDVDLRCMLSCLGGTGDNPDPKCLDCGGSGQIQLFTSISNCNCINNPSKDNLQVLVAKGTLGRLMFDRDFMSRVNWESEQKRMITGQIGTFEGAKVWSDLYESVALLTSDEVIAFDTNQIFIKQLDWKHQFAVTMDGFEWQIKSRCQLQYRADLKGFVHFKG